MPQSGFLGTTAPWTADVTLLLELALGTGLLAGAMLARAGRYRLHAACQSVIVLLNLALIVLTMIPAFHRQVLPKLPGRIAKPYYAFAATHAALGSVAELGGLYLLLAAGTNLLPGNGASRTTNSGCEAFSCFGGSFSYSDWSPMCAGTFRMPSEIESAECP